MTCLRPGSLRMVVVCLLLCGPVFSQPQQQQPPTQQPPPPQQKKNNPFETVPNAPEQPQPPKLETPPPAAEAPKPAAQGTSEDTIGSITFRGARRSPQDMLRSLLQTKVGDKYDPDSLNRDFMALWNTGRF
jgi:outer membrane protein insertion porin family